MSLFVDGFWKTGVWAITVWADGVWFEGAALRGLGGDDIPRRKSPHRGWDKSEWKRRVRDPEQAIEDTLREVYNDLTGEKAPAVVVEQAKAIVRTQKTNATVPLVIDWKAIAREYERVKALTRLWQEEQDLRAAIEDEDETIMLLVLQ